MPAGSPNMAKTRVFISYKRDVDPDQSLAARLVDELRKLGNEVFIDRTLRAGQLWAKEIETAVNGCDFFIPLLTASSSSSEMVKGEIEMARRHADKNRGWPKILPVRLNFKGALPYPLNAWLAPIQYASWSCDSDTGRLIDELASAINGAPLSSISIPEPAEAASSPPAYSAPLPAPGGGLDAKDPWYVRRSTDIQAIAPMAQKGETVVIKGPRQMGKTSLLVRTLEAAINAGKRCVLIDFQMLGSESMSDSKKFYQCFAQSIAQELDLPLNIHAFWNENLTPTVNLTQYMEKQVLGVISSSIVLAIDEADFLFRAPFMSDFFGMLRSWHNVRSNPVKAFWKRLDLILVTSTEPNLFITDTIQSPFNVGHVLSLCDFTEVQFAELNRAHQSPLNTEDTRRLYDLLSGQPYLARKAFYVLLAGTSTNELFENANESRGPFGDHLRYYVLGLANHPERAAALKQIAKGNGCTDNALTLRLEGAGLVKMLAGKVVPRCELYAQYFRDHL